MISKSGLEVSMDQTPKILSKGIFLDERGFFQEVSKEGDDVMNSLGTIRQINMSKSKKGTIRGIHAQTGMSKAMWVPYGSAQIVAVNLDVTSGDFGKVVTHHMGAGDGKVFWAPDNWGRGFLALEEGTIVSYACSDVYRPGSELGVNPMTCGVSWDLNRISDVEILVSDKDRGAQNIEDLKK
jgi:dTDP-4-dehydrorhamnose 3,5-epimerase